MEKKNIFWFIIDSVRTFRTGQDDRDRIDIMDEFSKDSIEFTNCYTSAPSSLLAAGAMFSGLPSVFVARHFNDWKFNIENISILKTLVEEHGYTSIPLINGRNAREKYKNLLSAFPSSFLPKGRYLRDYSWNNEEVTEIFEHIIKIKPFEDPFAFVFWYDCRRDPNTSKHVEKAINLIKEHGYYDDSIIAMHSDHGYPDPRTKLDESFFKGMGHDMILTDDNVKTPLFLKYPGAPSNIKINPAVGHIDILPTMFDILNIPMNKVNDYHSFKGKSLKPIIEGKEDNERCVRVDTRLQMDKDRITAYRKGDFKFIYFQDDHSSLLYDLKNDQFETQDLSKNNDYMSVLNDFKTIHDSYNKELIKFQFDSLKNNFFTSIKKHKIDAQNKSILIISPAPNDLLSILVQLIDDSLSPSKIDFLPTGDFSIQNERLNILDADLNNIGEHIGNESLYDLIIYVTHNSRRVFLKNNIVKQVKKLKARKKLLMNYNFEAVKYFSISAFFSYTKLYFDWERKGHFYKQEPVYFINDLRLFVEFIFKKIFSKKIKNDNDIMTAREVIAFRDTQLKNEKKKLTKMKEGEMEYEVQRIKEWGDE
tara:strand:- start:287 stop:2059 length:1773 start_codon:yes stop_codon:yes gene_type:complete